MAKSSANGLIGNGFTSQYWLQPRAGFFYPVGRCKATTPSFLTNNSQNLLTHCSRQTAQTAGCVCVQDSVLEPKVDISMDKVNNSLSVNKLLIHCPG